MQQITKHWIKHTTGTLVIALSVIFAPAAQGQSLIEALASTYNTNPDLLAARALLRQADETLAQAVSNWRPRVTLSIEYNKIEYDTLFPRAVPTYYSLNGRTTQLQVSQPLFRGGKTIADTKAAQANIQAQRAQLADTEQTILLSAVQAYADLQLSLDTLDARRSNVRVLKEQLESTNERFRVGDVTVTDVSQAQARLEQAQADLIQAEAQAHMTEATFQRLTGLRPTKLGDIPLIGALVATEDECVALAMDAAPKTTAAQFRISSATYGVNSSAAALLPQVNLTGFVQYQQDVQVPTDQYYQYGVRLQATIPIYQNGGEWSAIRQAKQLVAQRRNELDSARRIAAETAIRAWRGLAASRSRVNSFIAQVQTNQVALDGVKQEARVGARTVLDVLNAEQELLNSKLSLLQARHDVDVNYYAVLSSIGRLTARALGLPVDFYDEEKYYREVGSKWIGP